MAYKYKSPKRVGLVGCGRIATKRHAPLLGNNEVTGAVLAAVCDIDDAKASALSEQYQVPRYSDFERMMDVEHPHLVAILTPSGMHGRHIKEMLNYQVPLIVEKPLALIPAEAEEVTALAKRKGVPLFVVMQNRFNPAIVHLRHAVDGGRFGEINIATVTVRWCRHLPYYQDWHGTWAQAGGVLANQAIHHIDILTWLLGQPESVFAYATSSLPIDVENTLVAVLRYPGGALAVLELTAATRPIDWEGSITIQGTKGTAKIGGFAMNQIDTWRFKDSLPDDALICLTAENPPGVYGYGHKMFYEHVLECLEKDTASPIDGRSSLRVVTALYQSVETGREVSLAREPYSYRLGR